MAMTGVVKDELSRVPVVKPCCRKTEVSTLLRFAGGLTLTGGHIVIEAELTPPAVARRLRASIAEVFGAPLRAAGRSRRGLRKGNRYIVRVSRGGDSLARQAGLIDSFGRPVRGTAAAGRVRRDLRLRGRLARRAAGARVADRARPLDGA